MADDDDNSLIREVNEELRREQFAKLWDRYGLYALALAASIVAGVGGFKYWQFSSLEAAQAAGARYQNALQLSDDGNTGEASKLFAALAVDGPGGYGVLAQLKLAGAAVKAGRTNEAVRTYDAIVKFGGADPLLAGYAALRAATLRAGDAHFTEMQNRLNDLARDDGAWRHAARELLGVAAQQAGRTAEARNWYQRLLGDRNTPPGITARAKVMMAMLEQAEVAGANPAAGGKSGTVKPANGKPVTGKPVTGKPVNGSPGAANSN